jgi:hypothetical protein
MNEAAIIEDVGPFISRLVCDNQWPGSIDADHPWRDLDPLQRAGAVLVVERWVGEAMPEPFVASISSLRDLHRWAAVRSGA